MIDVSFMDNYWLTVDDKHHKLPPPPSPSNCNGIELFAEGQQCSWGGGGGGVSKMNSCRIEREGGLFTCAACLPSRL